MLKNLSSGTIAIRQLLPAVTLLGLGVFYYPVTAQGDPTGSVSGAVTVLDRNGLELEDRSNVVIFIDGVTAPPQTPSENPSISHKGQRFTPRVLPVAAGGAVNFLNDDGIYHNVFSLSKAKTFDLGVYPQGTSKFVEFDRPGLVKIYCNIHPDMVSTILVLNNTFFATTGPDGSYEITNVPMGDYTLRMWSELGEERSVPITVSEGSTTQAFVLNKTKGVSSHNNKFGKPYRKKY